jgi:hypothetical protein
MNSDCPAVDGLYPARPEDCCPFGDLLQPPVTPRRLDSGRMLGAPILGSAFRSRHQLRALARSSANRVRWYLWRARGLCLKARPAIPFQR